MLRRLVKRMYSQGPRADWYYKMDRYLEAQSLRRQLDADPGNTDLLGRYIRSLERAGQYQSAGAEMVMRGSHYTPLDREGTMDSPEEAMKRKSKRAMIVGLVLIGLAYFGAGYVDDRAKEEENRKRNGLASTDKKTDGKSADKKFNVNINLLDNVISSAKSIKPDTNLKERFKDVVGIDEFRAELEEIVDYLKDPKKYSSVGATFPKGILLSGPPGTGKTLIARAIAGEANCSFFYRSGSQFDEMWRGSGKDNVKALFTAAKAHSPAIVFIDEIDSLAGKRQRGGSRVTINQLLTELDGFQPNERIIFIAATNIEETLDPAVMRSGRIDKVVRIPLPDIGGRKQILQYYLDKIKSEKVDVDTLAKRTIGFSGADLKNFVNTAILRAVREGKKEANRGDFEFSYDRILMGIRRKNPLLNEEKRTETAVRQIGHALVSYFTEGARRFHKVTILPTGNTLGHTSFLPNKDELSQNRKNIIGQIDVFVAGRAAEEIFYGKDRLTTNCARELEKAANLGYYYVRDMGLENDKLFLNSDPENMSDAYKFKADTVVEELLENSLERTKAVLASYRPQVESLVKYLVERETLTFDEFEQILKSGYLPNK